MIFMRFKPCFNMSLKIASDRPDLHSGIEGGAVAEPMIDMFVFSCFIKTRYCDLHPVKG